MNLCRAFVWQPWIQTWHIYILLLWDKAEKLRKEVIENSNSFNLNPAMHRHKNVWKSQRVKVGGPIAKLTQFRPWLLEIMKLGCDYWIPLSAAFSDVLSQFFLRKIQLKMVVIEAWKWEVWLRRFFCFLLLTTQSPTAFNFHFWWVSMPF